MTPWWINEDDANDGCVTGLLIVLVAAAVFIAGICFGWWGGEP